MVILAPLSGVVVPLDAVPDPVFAGKMVGDGVAIDPTSTEVLAPFSGTITQLHQARHALAVTADNGVEVLIHVGLDTILLKGQGLTPLVSQGARVEAGQALLVFDADLVGRKARSLLTEVIVTSGDKVRKLAVGTVVAGRSELLAVDRLEGGAAASESAAGELVMSGTVLLPNAAGLHARPAAVLATEAKKYAARIRLARGGEEVNAKSVVAIMGLSAAQGDALVVKASGPGAQAAVARLASLLADGCGEVPGDAPLAPVTPLPVARQVQAPGAEPRPPGALGGAPASPGLAIGRIYQHRHATVSVQEVGGSLEEERAKLAVATREAAGQLALLKRRATDPAKAQIMGVHQALLEDPDLLELAEASLGRGKSASFAWQEAFASHADKLEKLGSPLMRERAADIRDVGRRVLAVLAGVQQAQLVVPERSILVARELSPSDTDTFDRSRVLGFCTVTGGPTSHVAILARSMGLPAVCGIDEAALSLKDGTPVVVDGNRGLLLVDPPPAELAQIEARIAREAGQRKSEAAAAHAQARTADGHRVEVAANIRTLKDAQEAVAAGAEGVGLLRSEFLLGGRDTAPGEEEQAASYLAVAQALGKDRPLIIRTLDVGGDKPLPWLPLAEEENPFLGVRGIRVSLAHPEIFRVQLRAILRAAVVGNVRVMFPMVSTLAEVRAARAILAAEQRSLPNPVQVGIMVEVPSAAVMAEVLAREVDFFSIGTNDLTQYALAMDRGHPTLGKQADGLDPAVLRLIAMTTQGAARHGKWVGVCGGIASDPLAVPVLVGMGVSELSVSVPVIGAVKAALGRWTLAECRALAAQVLELGSTAEVRALLTARAEAKDGVQGARPVAVAEG